MCMNDTVCACVCVCVCVWKSEKETHTQRERERERERQTDRQTDRERKWLILYCAQHMLYPIKSIYKGTNARHNYAKRNYYYSYVLILMFELSTLPQWTRKGLKFLEKIN